jgi:GNAT superfamily N-acetyltransferase
MTPTDEAFIAASWFESFWKRRALGQGITYEDYKAGQGALIERLMRSSTVTVAFATEVPDEIAGYSVVEGDTLHYVYVKKDYRLLGIGSSLVPEGTRFVSHDTGRPFVLRIGLKFNPYRLLPKEAP